MVHFELLSKYDTVCVRIMVDKKRADVSREVLSFVCCTVRKLFDSSSMLTFILFVPLLKHSKECR